MSCNPRKKKLTLLNLIKSDDDLQCFTGASNKMINNLVEAVEQAEGQRQAHRFGCSVRERIILTFCKLNETFLLNA